MIIKGSSQGTPAQVERLHRHLLAKENDVAEVVEIRGTVDTSLAGSLREMLSLSAGSRSKRPIYHSSINLDPSESAVMTPELWLEAVDELERHLGLTGHQRAVVRHVKRGRDHIPREHYHVCWNRIDIDSLRAVHDGNTYAKHESCARTLESRWNLRSVVGVHTKTKGTPRPVAKMTDQDRQAEKRSGISVESVAATLRHCWDTSSNGGAFAVAIEAHGLSLASGRRGIVVMAGNIPHSIPRRLGLPAGVVQQKLSDIDIRSLKSVDETKTAAPRRRQEGSDDMGKSFGAANPRARRRDQRSLPPLPAEYWESLGFTVKKLMASFLIRLSATTEIEDRGDRLTLHRHDGEEPSDEDIRILVAGCKAHMDRPDGWQGVRFFGGTPAIQRRCRAEALKQGIRADLISLQCEEAPSGLEASKMPEHVRRRLNPETDSEQERPPAVPIIDAPTPVPELRP